MTNESKTDIGIAGLRKAFRDQIDAERAVAGLPPVTDAEFNAFVDELLSESGQRRTEREHRATEKTLKFGERYMTGRTSGGSGNTPKGNPPMQNLPVDQVGDAAADALVGLLARQGPRKNEEIETNPHDIIVAWTKTEGGKVSVWLDRKPYVFQPSRGPDSVMSLWWLKDVNRRAPTEGVVDSILGKTRG